MKPHTSDGTGRRHFDTTAHKHGTSTAITHLPLRQYTQNTTNIWNTWRNLTFNESKNTIQLLPFSQNKDINTTLIVQEAQWRVCRSAGGVLYWLKQGVYLCLVFKRCSSCTLTANSEQCRVPGLTKKEYLERPRGFGEPWGEIKRIVIHTTRGG